MEESNIIIYQTEDGSTKIETRLEDETVWLTQAQLCDLFQKSKSTISEHIKNVFDENELDEKAVVRKFRTTAISNRASLRGTKTTDQRELIHAAKKQLKK